MSCNICGANNKPDALFCNKCGNRLDGKIRCKICSEWNESEAVFCNKCGNRLDGKAQCAECGSLLSEDDTFCSVCGCKVGVKNISAKPAKKSERTANAFAPLIMKKVKTGLAIGLASFTLIFLFLININGGYIYEFFGKAYKDIKSVLAGMEKYSNFFVSTLYLSVIFGTIISAATMLSVIGLSIAAIVKGSLHLVGKSNDTGERYAVWAYAVYLIGNIALLSLSGSETELLKVKLGGTSIAGIVLGAVCLAAYFAVILIINRKEIFSRDTLAKTVLTFINIALLIVTVIIISLPSLGINIEGEQMRSGYLVLLSSIGLFNGNPEFVLDGANGIFVAVSLFAFVFLMFVLAFSVLAFIREITVQKDAQTKSADYALLSAVFAILVLIFSVITGEMYGDLMNSSLGLTGSNKISVKCDYAVPICVLIFTVANAVIALVKKFAFSSTAPANVTEFNTDSFEK